MRNFTFVFTLVAITFLITPTLNAQVAINTDGTSAHTSAMLDVKSTIKGFLLPRMSTVQRNTLGSIATAGLVVYDTDLKKIFSYNGLTWDEEGVGNYWLRTGNKLYINNVNDSVGIGTAIPARKLEVSSGWKTARLSSSTSGAFLEFKGSNATNWAVGTWTGSARLLSSTDGFVNTTDEFTFTTTSFAAYTANSKTLGNNTARWQSVFSTDGDFSGNVGIGTSTPIGKLHVNDPTSSNTTIFITPKNTSSGDSATIFLAEDNDATYGMYWMFDGNGNQMELWGKSNSARYGPHLLVNRDNGDMAIGNTLATGYKLSVSGKIICTEVRVNLVADWPDYVFRKDYKLFPVEKLGAYIKEKGHLPNIPPAAEINKSGLDIGEMQRRMMEKIEELSLYIVDQQKQIQALMDQLNKRQL